MVSSGAEIQPDKNWTKIHNSILELLATSNFSARELRCLLFLLRSTYGYRSKEARISLSEWEKGTGLKRGHVSTTLKTLVERRVILKEQEGPRATPLWAFNKYFEQWQGSTHEGTSTQESTSTDGGTNNSTHEGTKGSTPFYSKTTPIKESKKDIYPNGDANASEGSKSLVEQFNQLVGDMNQTKNKVPYLIEIYHLCYGKDNAPNGGALAGAAKQVGSASLLAKYLFDNVTRPPVGPVLPYIIATHKAKQQRAKQTGSNREILEVQFTNGDDIYA